MARFQVTVARTSAIFVEANDESEAQRLAEQRLTEEQGEVLDQYSTPWEIVDCFPDFETGAQSTNDEDDGA